jgi:hypothetical protein
MLLYQYIVSTRQLQFKLLKKCLWLCAVVFIVSLTIFSTYFYREYSLDRKAKISKILSSLQQMRLINTTHYKRFESSLLPQRLNKFIEDYLTQDIRRYLIVTCETGIGNRLQSIASAFLMAMLMNRRLIIHWPVTSLSSCQHDQLFESQSSSSLNLFTLYTRDHMLLNSDWLEFHGPFDELLCHPDLRLFKSESQFVFLKTDEYFLSVLMKNPSYSQTLFDNVSEDSLFRSFVNYLFVPIKELHNEILNNIAKMGECHQGIQMRKNGLKQIPVNGEEIFLCTLRKIEIRSMQ